jgi:hypothetical protein
MIIQEVIHFVAAASIFIETGVKVYELKSTSYLGAIKSFGYLLCSKDNGIKAIAPVLSPVFQFTGPFAVAPGWLLAMVGFTAITSVMSSIFPSFGLMYSDWKYGTKQSEYLTNLTVAKLTSTPTHVGITLDELNSALTSAGASLTNLGLGANTLIPTTINVPATYANAALVVFGPTFYHDQSFWMSGLFFVAGLADGMALNWPSYVYGLYCASHGLDVTIKAPIATFSLPLAEEVTSTDVAGSAAADAAADAAEAASTPQPVVEPASTGWSTFTWVFIFLLAIAAVLGAIWFFFLNN